MKKSTIARPNIHYLYDFRHMVLSLCEFTYQSTDPFSCNFQNFTKISSYTIYFILTYFCLTMFRNAFTLRFLIISHHRLLVHKIHTVHAVLENESCVSLSCGNLCYVHSKILAKTNRFLCTKWFSYATNFQLTACLQLISIYFRPVSYFFPWNEDFPNLCDHVKNSLAIKIAKCIFGKRPNLQTSVVIICKYFKKSSKTLFVRTLLFFLHISFIYRNWFNIPGAVVEADCFPHCHFVRENDNSLICLLLSSIISVIYISPLAIQKYQTNWYI